MADIPHPPRPPASRDGRIDDGVRWLRRSYRVGAFVDAIAAAPLLHPTLSALVTGHTELARSPGYGYATRIGAALMLGWTALLLWADRRPLERRGVLGITALVVLGLAVNELVAVRAGFLPVGPTAAIWVLQAGLMALFVGSLAAARRTELPSAERRLAREP